uniref:Uncharacterized protein n=1 Tax=Romanomermis culicivorax TaxID=13658 RepID=A0A915HS16_ROMCU
MQKICSNSNGLANRFLYLLAAPYLDKPKDAFSEFVQNCASDWPVKLLTYIYNQHHSQIKKQYTFSYEALDELKALRTIEQEQEEILFREAEEALLHDMCRNLNIPQDLTSSKDIDNRSSPTSTHCKSGSTVLLSYSVHESKKITTKELLIIIAQV